MRKTPSVGASRVDCNYTESTKIVMYFGRKWSMKINVMVCLNHTVGNSGVHILPTKYRNSYNRGSGPPNSDILYFGNIRQFVLAV